jgi:hypothetical protein
VSHQYRTLSKVRVVDGLYESLWSNEGDDKNNNNNNNNNKNNSQHSNASSNHHRLINKHDIRRIDFGNSRIWTALDEEQCIGRDALERVLYALHHSVVGGIVDYAPLLPAIATILLGFMSESYVFYACREMYHYSTWFMPTSLSEDVATQRAFLDVLQKLHPQTYLVMQEQDTTKQFAQTIFQHFFTPIFPEWMVNRLMDIYTLEGSKVLFRFGVALAVLYGKEYKERYMYASAEPNKYWLGLFDYCHSGSEEGGLNFEVLVKKAYGVHGRGVRKRFRFPRRPILSRLVEMEEERYRAEQLKLTAESDASNNNDNKAGGSGSTGGDYYLQQIEPLGFIIPPPPTDPNVEPIVPRLVASTFVRTKLAQWMPLSLRFTKLDLVFSTSHHGRTLEAFYRNVSKSTHTIMIMEPFDDPYNKHKILVGMYASHAWHPSSRVYGDGRCFLFRIVLEEEENTCYKGDNSSTGDDDKPPESKCWKWQPADLFDLGSALSDDQNDSTDASTKSHASAQAALETFQISTKDFLGMGGNGKGGSGLRLNEDLTKAESSCAAGFDNEPLLPGAGGMFEVGLIEVYQIVRQMDGVPIR